MPTFIGVNVRALSFCVVLCNTFGDFINLEDLIGVAFACYVHRGKCAYVVSFCVVLCSSKKIRCSAINRI